MNKEDIKFLKDLQHEMLTQDCVCQANPRFWVVMQTVRQYGVDSDYGIDGTLITSCDDGDLQIDADNMEEVFNWFIENFEVDCKFEDGFIYINNEHSDNDFVLIDGEFNDFDNEYSSVYSVKDLFYNCWSILHDKYLRKYKTYCGLNESQLIDKWINVILALCIENGFIVSEITKDDIGLHKYDYNYEKVNKVYRIEYRED